MPNMSYCRFENTTQDMQDCIDALSEVDGSLKDYFDSLSSEYEQHAFKRFFRLCKEVAENYGDDFEEIENFN